jgi:hypothetical protein
MRRTPLIAAFGVFLADKKSVGARKTTLNPLKSLFLEKSLFLFGAKNVIFTTGDDALDIGLSAKKGKRGVDGAK